jgi:hypothetical protein
MNTIAQEILRGKDKGKGITFTTKTCSQEFFIRYENYAQWLFLEITYY